VNGKELHFAEFFTITSTVGEIFAAKLRDSAQYSAKPEPTT
jgi:hypothetical protein